MVDEPAPAPATGQLQPAPRGPVRRAGRWLLAGLLGLAALVLAAALLLDTGTGRRFLGDRIEQLAPDTGLRIRVGRIEGSIYRHVVLRDVRFYDPRGEFARIAEARVDWHPFDFIWARRLSIDSVDIPRASWSRIPKLRKSRSQSPILPDFDIVVGRLRVDRLILSRDVAGQERVARLSGHAILHDRTADIDLDAGLVGGGDRVRLTLVAAPDRDMFDADADVIAPRGGVLGRLAGIDHGLTGIVRGSGNWRHWRGSVLVDSDGNALARVGLSADDGRFAATGRVMPAGLTGGLGRSMTDGGVALDATARFVDRQLDGQVALVSDAAKVDVRGGLDLARNRFDAVRIDGWLRRPAALIPGFDGQNIQLALLLDGSFRATAVEYRLTAAWMSMGKIRLSGIAASGRGLVTRAGQSGAVTARLPLSVGIAQTSGIGVQAEGIVRNFSGSGTVAIAGDQISTPDLRLRAANLDAQVTASANMRTGTYAAQVTAHLPGIELRGFGRINGEAALRITPGAGNRPTITGRAGALMTRFDNGFFLGLTAGLPSATSVIALGSDGILRLTDLTVTSPALTLSGSGYRRLDGAMVISGTGMHQRYGPLTFSLDGKLERPLVDLTLRRPFPPGGLSDVHLRLLPTVAGYDFTGGGGSHLGPFTALGRLILPRGAPAVIELDRLRVSGVIASGRVLAVPRGLAGRLLVANGGVNGTITLSVPAQAQRIAVDLSARDARFDGDVPIAVRRGRLQATVVLQPDDADIDATFEGTGLRRGALSISQVTGTVRMRRGAGSVRASIAGARGRNFGAQFVVDFDRSGYRLRGRGTLDHQPIVLTRPAVILRSGDEWRLQSSEITFRGGTARLSGRYGGGTTEIDAALDRVPLALLDFAYPDAQLDGQASGRLHYLHAGGAPAGDAQLRLTGLARSGLTDTSRPVDVALNAALSPTSAAIRAVVSSDGAIVGRVQGRASPLAASGDVVDRVLHAPLTAQLRYSGEAGAFWRLTGLENLALSGPVAVAADVGGTLADPRLRGVVRTSNARFESFQTGTVITGISAIGRFEGSRLQLRSISGATGGGGRVTGEGDFDLSTDNGLAIDLRLAADRALMIERDDLSARVSGPIRLFSTGAGGVISGRLRLDEGRFRLGRATAVDALPVLTVREINPPADRPEPARARAPWRLDLAVAGADRLTVTGLGITSDWSTDLTVRGDVSNFALAGTARLVRGDYQFAGRRFRLDSGTIRFTGSTPVDPVLDITAVSDVTGIDATIRVRGSGLRPEITFSSVPALPEDELLSRILFGSSITDISVAEAAQLASALAALRSGDGGLDPINAVRRATGLDRLRILPPNSEIGSGTAVAAGKYVTRQIFVEVITDGQGYSATRVEFQITRWLALLGSISTLNQESINVRIKHDY